MVSYSNQDVFLCKNRVCLIGQGCLTNSWLYALKD
jgi:hypothetical protein